MYSYLHHINLMIGHNILTYLLKKAYLSINNHYLFTF